MMPFLVAIHDVTPALATEVQSLWDRCVERGIRPALLVVPQWHGGHPIESDRAFARWLRERADDGAEIFLHGERHDEVGSPRTLADHVRAFGRTAREAEFLTLRERDARHRIERGVARLRRLGLRPIGFVAPAWLARRDTSLAVAAAGLQYSEDERDVVLHARATRLPIPVIRWSARSDVRARASVAVADARWHLRPRASAVRIALHPSDLYHPLVARSVVRTLDRWLAVRSPIRYADL